MSDKKTRPKLDLKQLLDKLSSQVKRLQPYSFGLFLVFVGLLYGFVFYKTNSLDSAQPSSQAVTSQVQAANLPRIDPFVIQQLQSLQDNSVSVKLLFQQARTNPFQ